MQRHPGILAYLPFSQDALFLALDEMVFEYLPTFLGPSSPQGFMLSHPVKQCPEEVEVCSPEVQSSKLAAKPCLTT